MKLVLIAKTLLFVIATNFIFSCSESAWSDPGEDLMNTLSTRLDEKDFVSDKDLKKVNPFESLGQKLDLVYHNLYRYPLAEPNDLIYGSSLITTDEKRQKTLKQITKTELEAEGLQYSEKDIDEYERRIAGYKFTSEDMTQYFQDAENSHAITPIEHKVLMLQLQAISSSKTNTKAQEIIRTFEFEVDESGIDLASKQKILMINAIARNLLNNPRLSVNESVNLFPKTFQQTTPVVVGTVLVVFAVASLITAWNDPNCNNACQQQMASNAFVYSAAGTIVCTLADSGEPCPDGCMGGCFRNATGFCVCP